MSIQRARELVNLLQSQRGRISSTQVGQVWTEITKQEPGDEGTGRTRKSIQAGEEEQWTRLGELRARMIIGTATRTYDTNNAKVGALRIVGGSTGQYVSLMPADSLRPVYLDRTTGWIASRSGIAGQPDQDEIWAGTRGLAKGVQQSYELTGKMPVSLQEMDLTTRNKLVDRLIAASKMRLANETDTMQLRSNCFTSLWALGVVTNSEGSGSQVAQKIHTALTDMTKGESALLFALSMATRLIHPRYQEQLNPTQKKGATETAELRFNQTWPIDKIRDAQGYVHWEHVSGEGEGFFRSFKAQIQKREILQSQKFRKTGEDSLQIDFPTAVSPDGRTKGIKLSVRENNNNIYDSAGDPTGISVGAHSEIGEMQKESADRAQRNHKRGTLDQPILVDVCAGLDRLDYVLQRVGVRPITTHDSSLFWKGNVTDERGTFPGVVDSEDMGALVELWKGLLQGENAKQIGDRFKRVIAEHHHAEPPNYHAGSIDDYKRVILAHLDLDHDGHAENDDVHFDVGLKALPRDLANEFVKKNHGVFFDDIDGEVVFQSVPHLNTSTHYNTFLQNNDSVLHKFVADGFHDGSKDKALIRFKEGSMIDDRKAIQVSWNSDIGHMSWQAAEALTPYGGFVWACDQNLIRGVTGVDQIIGGLMLAAFRLNYGSNGGSGRDSDTWKQLLKAAGLPEDLPYEQMASLIGAQHHDYSGNRQVIDDYREYLQQNHAASLELMSRPGAGRKIFG